MYIQFRGENINWNITKDVVFLLKVRRQRTSSEGNIPPSDEGILYCTLPYNLLKMRAPCLNTKVFKSSLL